MLSTCKQLVKHLVQALSSCPSFGGHRWNQIPQNKITQGLDGWHGWTQGRLHNKEAADKSCGPQWKKSKPVISQRSSSESKVAASEALTIGQVCYRHRRLNCTVWAQNAYILGEAKRNMAIGQGGYGTNVQTSSKLVQPWLQPWKAGWSQACFWS